MTISRIQAVIAFVLMACAVAGAHLWRPTAHLADSRAKVDLEQMFPRAFGDWKMDALPVQLVAPDVAQLLASIYSQTLSRTYVNSQGQRIMLSVAYGGDQSDATRAHRPEVCYPAQGFQIVASRSGSVPTSVGGSIPVRQLVAKMGSRVEPITFWITVGDSTTVSGTEQKLAQLRYSMRGVIPDGMLVRVSSIDANAEQAYVLQGQFVSALSSAVRPDLRPQIFGQAG
jgi:EpsI family protein